MISCHLIGAKGACLLDTDQFSLTHPLPYVYTLFDFIWDNRCFGIVKVNDFLLVSPCRLAMAKKSIATSLLMVMTI